MIRMYCENPGHSILKGPQIHFGNNAFNLEWSGFEWAQGLLAAGANKFFGVNGCDAVEPIARTVSTLFSAAALVGVALLASAVWGQVAGFLAAFLLATDGLWLRQAIYTMIENRVVAIATFAIWLSLANWGSEQRQRSRQAARLSWLVTASLWTLSAVQKPQVFMAAVFFWLGLYLYRFFGHSRKANHTKSISQILRDLIRERRFLQVLASISVAALVCSAWLGYSAVLDRQSDLPWIIHTGPRAQKWYFGTWAERLEWIYWKSLILGWLRESGLNLVLPAILLLGFAAQRRASHGQLSISQNTRSVLLETARRALPLLLATFAYTFAWHHVFVLHEYYALPLNMMRAVTLAGVITLFLEQVSRLHSAGGVPKRNGLRLAGSSARARPSYATSLALALFAIFLARNTVLGALEYADTALHANDPKSPYYYPDWGKAVFPSSDSRYPLVIMAGPGSTSGRDLIYLYLAKSHGFVWCAKNEAYAPRAYWKKEGVRYVAWAKSGSAISAGPTEWTVRTIDEELARARKNGWSSDVNDVWAGKSMAEWAALASATGNDPCIEPGFDPRTWNKNSR
jgi:hypothetical protein